MNKYIINELQNAGSSRAGKIIEADSLSAAKRCAQRARLFQETVLTVSSVFNDVLSVRLPSGKWEDQE